jgi:hypothetical protein
VSTDADIASHPDPGLCGTCSFARLVRSKRGSSFHRCRRSDEDDSYARYPRLPVLACLGYAAEDGRA